MIPISTRFGAFLYDMEQNRSFKELDAELRSIAKSVKHNILDGDEVYSYITKKSFFSGTSEVITISQKNNKILMIGINSKDAQEYIQIADILRSASPMIKRIRNNGNSETFETFESDFLFQIGQNMHQDGDNILTIIRNG